MKIKHINKANETVILPEVGSTKLNSNGECTVPDEIGEQLIGGGNWSEVQQKSAPAAETTKDTAKAEKPAESPKEVVKTTTEGEAKKEEKPESTELSAEEKALMIESVKQMNHEELVKFATEGKVKGAQMFKAPEKIETLRNLVIKNIQK